MSHLSFQPVGDSWTFVVASLLSLLAGLFWLRSKELGISAFRRRVEFSLRVLLALILAVLLTRPSVVSIEKEELPASVVFLCDVSQSMSLRDSDDERARYERLRDAFTNVDESFRELCDKCEVRAYAFGEELQELEIDDGRVLLPDAPLDSETKLGDAVVDVLRANAGKRTLGVVALSDGAQRAKFAEDAVARQDAALRARDAEIPIIAVPFGSESAAATTRDVAVLDLRANDRVFLGNDLNVSGQVRLVGCAGRKVPLTLSLETQPGVMEVVAQTILEPQSADATLAYQFQCRPKEQGVWKIEVAAELQPNELVETNNALGSFVKALDRGVDALYIEGTRRYEQKFLRAALEASADVRARYWRPSTVSLLAQKTTTATEAEMLAERVKSRKSLASSQFVEGKYAVVVLGDVDSSAFHQDELEAIAQLVESGTGLIVLAGERSLGLGGYANTPLADVLPIQLSEADRLPLSSDLATFESDSALEQRARIDGSFRATPARANGRDDFIAQLSLDAQKNLNLWNSLPPLGNVYRLGKEKPGARVVLSAQSVDDNGKIVGSSRARPLLVTQRYGAGRVAVLATDSTWRWRMRGFENEHAKFWRQLLLWTAKIDELLEGELSLELDRSRFATDERVAMRANYRPVEGENVDGMSVRAKIIAPNGAEEKIEFTSEEGYWTAVANATSAPGDYLVVAELVDENGQVAQTARARFMVNERNLELENPEADRKALEQLAATTNGKVVEPEELQSVIEELLVNRESVVDEREVKKSLYDVWFVFFTFLALATCDWILRRLWGMA